jgi:hypothetical protein
LDTDPKDRGREGSAGERSQRNWTSDSYCLSQPLSGRSQLRATQCNQSASHPGPPPLRGESVKRKRGLLRNPPQLQSQTSAGTQPLYPAPSLQPGRHVWLRSGSAGRAGLGLRHRPGPGIREVTRVCRLAGGPFAHGHALPMGATLALGAAQLLQASQTCPTLGELPVRVGPLPPQQHSRRTPPERGH